MPIDKLALAELLEAEDGLVGRLVAAEATIVRDLARANVKDIMHRMPEGELQLVLESIDFEQEGTTATVGIKDIGPIEQYLAVKELRELKWLFPAAAETFSADNQAAVSVLLGGIFK